MGRRRRYQWSEFGKPLPQYPRRNDWGNARILTAAAIDTPDTVMPASFTGASLASKTLTVTLPAKSVVMLDIR